MLAPPLRDHYSLSLTQVGVLLAAPVAGVILTSYVWGLAADWVGERTVVATGLGAAAICLVFAAFAGSFVPLVALLLLTGVFGASVNSASGRAVMHWFEAQERGLALGIRQSAGPIGGTWAALALPPLVSGDDVRPAILTLAVGCLAGGIVCLFVLRERPSTEREPDAQRTRGPLRDRGLWLLSAGSALMLAPQACLVGFLVLFLHERREMSTAAAAAVLAVVNVFGIVTRIAAGRWSDLVGSRLVPLRRIGLSSAVLVATCALLMSAPLVLLVPVVVVMGCVAISWNGLSFIAAAETAGHARSGSALGLQQTALAIAAAVLPIAFGTLIAATSWRAGFAVAALFPLAGWRLLASVPADRATSR